MTRVSIAHSLLHDFSALVFRPCTPHWCISNTPSYYTVVYLHVMCCSGNIVYMYIRIGTTFLNLSTTTGACKQRRPLESSHNRPGICKYHPGLTTLGELSLLSTLLPASLAQLVLLHLLPALPQHRVELHALWGRSVAGSRGTQSPDLA